LTHDDILTAIAQQGPTGLVGSVMHRDFQRLDANEMLESALMGMHNPVVNTISVTSRGLLVGLLTVENIREFLLIQSALRKAPKRDGLVGNTVSS
jgi:predicted transcriptional regulator